MTELKIISVVCEKKIKNIEDKDVLIETGSLGVGKRNYKMIKRIFDDMCVI